MPEPTPNLTLDLSFGDGQFIFTSSTQVTVTSGTWREQRLADMAEHKSRQEEARRVFAQWWAYYKRHVSHPGFHLDSNIIHLRFRMQCDDCEETPETDLTLTDVKHLSAEERTKVTRIFQHQQSKGRKACKQRERRSSLRARALLCKYLTREQRQQLKGTNAFLVKGQDGNTYEIRYGGHGGVYRLSPDNGKPDFSFCIVTHNVPIYDQMLVQKLLLEKDIYTFMTTAHVTNVVNHTYYPNGLFLVDPTIDVSQYQREGAIFVQGGQHQIVVTNPALPEGFPIIEDGSFLNVLHHDILPQAYLPVYDAYPSRAYAIGLDQETLFEDVDGSLHVPLHPVETDAPTLFLRFLELLRPRLRQVQSLEEAQGYFDRQDQRFGAILLHNDTGIEPDYIRTYVDARVPPGIVYCFSEPETLGVHVSRVPTREFGFLLNRQSVVVYNRRT